MTQVLCATLLIGSADWLTIESSTGNFYVRRVPGVFIKFFIRIFYLYDWINIAVVKYLLLLVLEYSRRLCANKRLKWLDESLVNIWLFVYLFIGINSLQFDVFFTFQAILKAGFL